MIRRALAASVLLVGTVVFAAGSLPVDAGKSRITATFTQMNVPVDGRFQRFNGSVNYDPANVAASSAELGIDTASFDIGDEEYNAEVRKQEWFDSKAHPTATFRSSAIRSLGANRFEATGTLSLKGKTQTVKAPVSVKTEGASRRFEGELPISRAAFGLGDAEWNEVLEDKVLVKFVIVVPAS
ncbi:MAG: polyisoprenoid-binding protein [Panacagrimonas sp.]|nr:YceI family protein [Panacagrimonas sp.]MCC2658858.1 polyisoprenoid-binding protein [Panacagrimonas sp.]